MEFGATYPYADKTPKEIGPDRIGSFKGSFGKTLRGLSKDETLAALPTYARDSTKKFPAWKIDFIRQNRELYKRHKKWIDKWLPGILDFYPSFQKFEWNCKGERRDIWRYVIQFRASGIRVKRPTTAPSLVAMPPRPTMLVRGMSAVRPVAAAVVCQTVKETHCKAP